jgi:hypothetical protein
MLTADCLYPMCNSFNPRSGCQTVAWGGAKRNPRNTNRQPVQPATPAAEPGPLCRPFHGLAGVGVGHPGVPLLLHPRLRSDADSVG